MAGVLQPAFVPGMPGLLPWAVLVVVLVGLQEGVITGAVQVAGVVIALVTTAMTAPLFDAFVRKTAPKPPPVPSG